jgi:hypothetical protein
MKSYVGGGGNIWSPYVNFCVGVWEIFGGVLTKMRSYGIMSSKITIRTGVF